MRNLLLTALIFSFLFSCKKAKDISGQSIAKALTATNPLTASIINHIGDPNRTPNLYIVDNESDWEGWGDRGLSYGINAQNPILRKVVIQSAYMAKMYDAPIGDTIWTVQYRCPIGNKARQEWSSLYNDWSQNDFVVCRSCDGLYDSVYQGYDYYGLIEVMPYKDGEHYTKDNKLSFWFLDNAHKLDFDWDKRNWRYQQGDTMSIYARSADEYNTYIKVPSHIVNGERVPDEGYYAFPITVNPDGLITESDYTDNTSILTFRIVGTSAILDPVAIQYNAPKQITDLKATYDGRGKYKIVTLTWTSFSNEYCVQRDGVMIKKDQYSNLSGNQVYVDTVTGSWKGSTYRILAENEHLGKTFSLPATVKK